MLLLREVYRSGRQGHVHCTARAVENAARIESNARIGCALKSLRPHDLSDQHYSTSSMWHGGSINTPHQPLSNLDSSSMGLSQPSLQSSWVGPRLLGFIWWVFLVLVPSEGWMGRLPPTRYGRFLRSTGRMCARSKVPARPLAHLKSDAWDA